MYLNCNIFPVFDSFYIDFRQDAKGAVKKLEENLNGLLMNSRFAP